VEERVHDYLEAGLIPDPDDADVTIDRDTTIALGDDTASASRVDVAYPFTFIVLQPVAQLVVGGSTVGAPLTMTTSATMRNEM